MDLGDQLTFAAGTGGPHLADQHYTTDVRGDRSRAWAG